MTTVFDMHVGDYGVVYNSSVATLFCMEVDIRFKSDKLAAQVDLLPLWAVPIEKFNLPQNPIGRVLDDWELEPRIIQFVDKDRHIMPLRSKCLLIE